MTNQSRLKILGIGLVIVGLGIFVLVRAFFIPHGYPTEHLVLPGWLLPIIGLGCYAKAKERSVFWAAMAVVSFLGPILALVAIGIDDVLAKRTAPPRMRRVVKAGFVLSFLALFFGIAIPAYLNYPRKSRQAEARTHLRGIYVAETAFWEELGRYGIFDEAGFTLEGNSHRYTYRIDNSGKPGTVFPATYGTLTPDNTVVQAGVSADGQSFTATATGNLDTDPTIDQWHVNDIKENLRKADVNDLYD